MKPPYDETNVLTKRPMCDVCAQYGERVPAAVDGKTKSGPWAYLCPYHHEVHGVGVGLGLGQYLIIDPDTGEEVDA